MMNVSVNQTGTCTGKPLGSGPGIFRVLGSVVEATYVDGGRIGCLVVGYPTNRQAIQACNRLRAAIQHPVTAAASTLNAAMSRENLRAFLAEELAEELAELASNYDSRTRVHAALRRYADNRP